MTRAGAGQELADKAEEAEPRVHSTPARTTRAAAAAAEAAEGENMDFGTVVGTTTPASARPTTMAEPSSSQLVSNGGSASEGEGRLGASRGQDGSGGGTRAGGPFSSVSAGPRGSEYLFLSHTFVHQKLKAFAPPCQIEVQIEADGEMLPTVYQGMLQDSSAKGYYMLTAPPRELVANKEIFGLRLKSDGRIILQIKDRARPLNVDEGRRRLNPRVIGITTSIRVDFLKACFREISEPRHAISVKIEVNGVRQPELFTGASISHNRQGSFYVLGLPFALVHGREFVAWRQLDENTLELAVQDVDPAVAAAAAARLGGDGAGTGSAYSRRAATSGIVVDSRISIPLAMLKRDLAEHLETLLPGGLGPAFDIPARVQYRVDGKMLPRIYEQAVIKKSEHRGCCYLNGTERIPVKSKVLCGLEMENNHLVILDFKSQGAEELPRRNSPSVPGTSPIGRGSIAEALSPTPSRLGKGGSATAASAKEIIEKLTAGGMAHATAKELAAALVQAAEVAVAADAVTEPTGRRGKRGAGASNPTTPRANIIGAGGDGGTFAPAPASAGGTARSRLASAAASTRAKTHADASDDEADDDLRDATPRPRSVMRRTAAEVVKRATKADGVIDEEEMLAAAAALAGPFMGGQGNGLGSAARGRGKRTGGAAAGRRAARRFNGRAADSDHTETDTQSEASEEEAAEVAELRAMERREKKGRRPRRGGAVHEEEDEDEEGGQDVHAHAAAAEVAKVEEQDEEEAAKPVDVHPPARKPRVRHPRPPVEEDEEEEGTDPLAALQWVVRRPRTGPTSTTGQPSAVGVGHTPPSGRTRRGTGMDNLAQEGESSFDDLVAAASHLSEQQGGATPAGKRSRLASTAATHPTPASKGGRSRGGRGSRAADSDEEHGPAVNDLQDAAPTPGSLQGFSGQQMLQIIQMQQEAVAQNLIAQALAQQQVQAAQAHASTPGKKQKGGPSGLASPGLAPGTGGLGFPGMGLGLGLGGISGSPLVNPLAFLTGGLGLGLGSASPLGALGLASPGMAGLPMAADTSVAGGSAGAARKRKRAGDTRAGSDDESAGSQRGSQPAGLVGSMMVGGLDPMTAAALFGGGGLASMGGLGGLSNTDLANLVAMQQAAALQQQQQQHGLLLAAVNAGEAPKVEHQH